MEVRKVFLHCAKAVRRSSLWKPEGWPDTDDMPTIACMLPTHAGFVEDPDGTTLAVALEVGHASTLWNPAAGENHVAR